MAIDWPILLILSLDVGTGVMVLDLVANSTCSAKTECKDDNLTYGTVHFKWAQPL